MMKLILYGFSWLWIAAGACVILYTGQSRASLKQLFEEIHPRAVPVMALVVGVCLLWAAPAARNGWFVVLMGLLALIKGGLFLVNPENVWEKVRNWAVGSATDQTYRFGGILMLLVGTALFSWVK